MKRYIHALCVMLLTALCLTSCLKGDDTEVTYYDDMAITTFELSVVNRYIHKTTSAGNDTITMTTLKSGLPIFTIDQYQHQIYNRVPLPTGCDLEHVLASITSKNSGQIVMKSLTSDSLFYYSSTDSLDFSQSRELRVYALDGSGYRTYTVTVNIENSENDKMRWTEYTSDSPEIPTALYQTFVLQRNILDGDEGDAFQLSKDGGNTWTYELLGDGEDFSLLPDSGIAWVSFPYSASKNTDYELMVGSCEAYNEACTVWRKIVDRDDLTTSAKWVNISIKDSKSSYLPKMNPISLVSFGGSVYAIGNEGKIYETRDGGITWKVSDDISLPDGFESNNVKAVTGEDGSLWLMDTDNGRVWRGEK